MLDWEQFSKIFNMNMKASDSGIGMTISNFQLKLSEVSFDQQHLNSSLVNSTKNSSYQMDPEHDGSY